MFLDLFRSKETIVDSRVGRLKGNLSAVVRTDWDFVKGRIAWMVTVTYRPGMDWDASHWSGAVDRFRSWARFNCSGARYLWVAELQKRGAVHYHLIAWLPPGVAMPKWDACGWWPHGMTRSEQLLTGIGYVLKYLSKVSHFHKFPKGLRLCGSGGFSSEARAVRTWKNLPQWTRDTFGVGEVTRRACGLVVRATGEILESPWVVFRGGGRLFVRLVGELPPRFADGPYSRVRV